MSYSRLTKPSCLIRCHAAMGEIAGRTACAKCRQIMMHVQVWVLQSHKPLYLGCGRKEFCCGTCIENNYIRTSITHMAPRWMKFCRGLAGSLRHFATLGPIWKTNISKDRPHPERKTPDEFDLRENKRTSATNKIGKVISKKSFSKKGLPCWACC